MKQTKHILLLAALLLSSLAVSAHSFEVGGIYYNITSSTDLTVEVTFRGGSPTFYPNEYSGAVIIPSTVTFSGKTYSVTSIGDYAFYECYGLTSITIPENVTSIGANAFYNCRGLATITIPENSQLASIGANAFYNCDREEFTSINIPEGVTSIGDYAFYACRNLTTITLSKKTKMTSIQNGTFRECNRLTAITIPESVTSIGDEAFAYCITLTSITIPEDVTSIGERAFLDCRGLTSITIPASVTSIGNLAFASCGGISTITIPEGVTSIGNGAFAGCSSLTAINVADGNANYDSRGGCNAIIETSSNTLIAGCASTIIPEGVTSIGNYAFDGCSSLTTITIPVSVTSIGSFVFNGCTSLTAITLPEGVTSIGDYAFSYCRSLTSINIPVGVTSIERSAFENCNSFTDITIPEGVTSIGMSAFENCNSLTDIAIPESVNSIGHSAFNGTAWYDNQPDGVIYAGKVLYAYKGDMPENTTIEVKEGIVSISEGAFVWCSNLTSITIPESVTNIGIGAFDECRNLTSITIPSSVTSIGDYTFRGCSSLASITIPEGVTSIGESAFYGCINLKVVKNFSNLNIVKGSKNHGYVAYYADAIVTKGVFLDFTELKLTAGESATLTATIVPEENCTVEWTSSDNAVAIVDNNGKVTAVAAGTAVITAKAGEKVATCEVIVEAIPVSGITLNYTSVELVVGETLKLVATVTPDNALDKTVTWSSSNASVVSVDEKGNVTVLKTGRTVTITATAGNCTARCTIKVSKAVEVEGVTLSQTEANLFVGETLALFATITPNNATNKTITWATSNNSVASVDSNGVITAVAEGTATITAKAGDKEATCIVTVSIPDGVEQLTIDKSQSTVYDLHGRRVENPGKGIYIIGGKKVVIK